MLLFLVGVVKKKFFFSKESLRNELAKLVGKRQKNTLTCGICSSGNEYSFSSKNIAQGIKVECNEFSCRIHFNCISRFLTVNSPTSNMDPKLMISLIIEAAEQLQVAITWIQ